MAITSLSELGDTIPVIIEEAQFTQEHDAKMRPLCWNIRKGKGTTVNVPYFGTFASQRLVDGVDMTSSETMGDTNVQITPFERGVKGILTDNVIEDDNEDLKRACGVLLGKAYERDRDIDLLGNLDNGTTSLGGAGTTLTLGFLAAGRGILAGNPRASGGPAPQPYAAIIHPFNSVALADIFTPLVPTAATAGLQSIGSALADEVIRKYAIGRIFGMPVIEDGNLVADTADDVKGGIFATGTRGGIIYVSAREPRIEDERDASLRAWELNYVGRYGHGNYLNGWTVELLVDAATPT